MHAGSFLLLNSHFNQAGVTCQFEWITGIFGGNTRMNLTGDARLSILSYLKSNILQ